MAIECNCGQLNERGRLRCSKCGAELEVPEVPEPELPEPEPFGLTSGTQLGGMTYDRNQAVVDAIKQFGPQQWTPFNRR